MKKFVGIFLVLVIMVSLVACGGPDKQPAIDAFNKTSAAFNEVSAYINQDPTAYADEVISTMTDMANLLNQYSEILAGDQTIEQEQLDEMIAWFAEVDAWVADVKAELGI